MVGAGAGFVVGGAGAGAAVGLAGGGAAATVGAAWPAVVGAAPGALPVLPRFAGVVCPGAGFPAGCVVAERPGEEVRAAPPPAAGAPALVGVDPVATAAPRAVGAAADLPETGDWPGLAVPAAVDVPVTAVPADAALPTAPLGCVPAVPTEPRATPAAPTVVRAVAVPLALVVLGAALPARTAAIAPVAVMEATATIPLVVESSFRALLRLFAACLDIVTPPLRRAPRAPRRSTFGRPG